MLRKLELSAGLDEPHGSFNRVDWTVCMTFPFLLVNITSIYLMYFFQVAGIVLAVIFLLHGLLAVGFKVLTQSL